MKRLTTPVVCPGSISAALNRIDAPSPFLVAYTTPPAYDALAGEVLPVRAPIDTITLERHTYGWRTGPGPFDYITQYQWVVTCVPDAFPGDESLFAYLKSKISGGAS